MSAPGIETAAPLSQSKTDNWVARAGGLPHPVQHVARALMAAGMPESEAVATALSRAREWASGGQHAHPDTRAVYRGAIAEWDEKRVRKEGNAAWEAGEEKGHEAWAAERGGQEAWDAYQHPRGYHGKWIASLNSLRRSMGLRHPGYEEVGRAERALRAAEAADPVRARAAERNAVTHLGAAVRKTPESDAMRPTIEAARAEADRELGRGGPSLADRIVSQNPPREGEASFEHLARIVARLPPEVRHEVLFKTREHYQPVDYIAKGMDRWRDAYGLPNPKQDLSEVRAPMEKAKKVGEAFGMTEDQAKDPVVQKAFADFKRQNKEMWDFMTAPESEGGLGIKVDFTTKKDPYPTAEAQADDLRDNHHVTIESGLGGDHSGTMTRREYDRFRAVHDVFGHAGIGGGFDRHGEYQAWLAHMSMYTGEGRDAMSSEYHGVNTAMWTKAKGTTTTGKSVLLPKELIANPFDENGNLVRKALDAEAVADGAVRALDLKPGDAVQLEDLHAALRDRNNAGPAAE